MCTSLYYIVIEAAQTNLAYFASFQEQKINPVTSALITGAFAAVAIAFVLSAVILLVKGLKEWKNSRIK
jgi:hypothetical protein